MRSRDHSPIHPSATACSHSRPPKDACDRFLSTFLLPVSSAEHTSGFFGDTLILAASRFLSQLTSCLSKTNSPPEFGVPPRGGQGFALPKAIMPCYHADRAY